MPQSFACLHTHIIFSTKNREPLVSKELHPKLGKYIAGILRNIGCRLITAGGVGFLYTRNLPIFSPNVLCSPELTGQALVAARNVLAMVSVPGCCWPTPQSSMGHRYSGVQYRGLFRFSLFPFLRAFVVNLLIFRISRYSKRFF